MMAANVYSWPPVAVLSRDWTFDAPIAVSRSMQTGRRYVSAIQRRRRRVSLIVDGGHQYGAGYMEALKGYLDGGVHLVRLTSCKIPFGEVAPSDARGVTPFGWQDQSLGFSWRDPPQPMQWVVARKIHGILDTRGPVPTMTMAGLPPTSLVALPGEFATVDTPTGRETHMIASPVRADGAGSAKVRLVTAPSASGLVTLGTRETAVFEATSIPRAQRKGNEFEPYTWDFREVFADEAGGFVEIDPWN